MVEGLLWLPLLGVFIALAWGGWHEYQKLTVCQNWAQTFDRYKYDLACVLGQNFADPSGGKPGQLVWGKPSRKGPLDVQGLDWGTVRSVQLFVGDRILLLADAEALSESEIRAMGRSPVGLYLVTTENPGIRIPFTDFEMARSWAQALNTDLIP